MRKLTLFILLLFIEACSPKVVSFYVVDEDKISVNSFSFYARDTNELRPQQKELDSLIERSITSELLKKGFKERHESDIIVSYQITLGTSSISNVNNQHFNNNQYNRMYYPHYGVTTTNYKEGVLLIEFWDKNEKLLWQGSKSFKVRKTVDTKEMFIEYAKEIAFAFKTKEL